MLASPSDVNEERRLARDIILDWNNVNSSVRKIVLLPLSWDLNAIPTMGNRPQEIINTTVLKNADILVGIFWTRIGTPTGKAISGTVEEIEEHMNSGKPAMLYFSKKPVVPDSIDPDQYGAVKKLKAEFQGKGLTYDFDTVEDFRNQFQRHLSIKLNEDEYFKSLISDKIDALFPPAAKNKISLSDDAKILLIEASKDGSGEVIKVGYSGGFAVQTNGKQINKDSSPREKARWEAAIGDLINLELLTTVGYKGEIFRLTDSGYEVADKLSY